MSTRQKKKKATKLITFFLPIQGYFKLSESDCKYYLTERTIDEQYFSYTFSCQNTEIVIAWRNGIPQILSVKKYVQDFD